MTVSRRGPSKRLDDFLQNWSVPRQFAGADHKGAAARSELSEGLQPRLAQADRVGVSVCPYCAVGRSEEHTSELQSLMRISYAVFCLKKKKKPTADNQKHS